MAYVAMHGSKSVPRPAAAPVRSGHNQSAAETMKNRNHVRFET